MVARHADVDHIGGSRQQVAQCDVGDADEYPTMAQTDAEQHGQQHHEVLQDDEDAEAQEQDGDGAHALLRGLAVLEASGEVVMLQDETAAGAVVDFVTGRGWAERTQDLHGVRSWNVELNLTGVDSVFDAIGLQAIRLRLLRNIRALFRNDLMENIWFDKVNSLLLGSELNKNQRFKICHVLLKWKIPKRSFHNNAIEQRSQTQFLEGHSSSQFSSNQL